MSNVSVPQLRKATGLVAALALGLMVLTLLKPIGALVVVRALLWGVAGGLTAYEYVLLRKHGDAPKTTLVKAVAYFALAAFVFFMGR
jgi:hypothetical protein